MEAGYETVSFADLDEDIIIGIHPLATTDTRATVFLADFHDGQPLPRLRIVYTEDYGSPEALRKSTKPLPNPKKL